MAGKDFSVVENTASESGTSVLFSSDAWSNGAWPMPDHRIIGGDLIMRLSVAELWPEVVQNRIPGFHKICVCLFVCLFVCLCCRRRRRRRRRRCCCCWYHGL